MLPFPYTKFPFALGSICRLLVFPMFCPCTWQYHTFNIFSTPFQNTWVYEASINITFFFRIFLKTLCLSMFLSFHLSNSYSYSKIPLWEAPTSCYLCTSSVISLFTLDWYLYFPGCPPLHCELCVGRGMYPWVTYLKNKNKTRVPQLPHF